MAFHLSSARHNSSTLNKKTKNGWTVPNLLPQKKSSKTFFFLKQLPDLPSLRSVTSPMISSAFWIHSCDLFNFRGSSTGSGMFCGFSARLWACHGPTGPGNGGDDDDDDDDDNYHMHSKQQTIYIHIHIYNLLRSHLKDGWQSTNSLSLDGIYKMIFLIEVLHPFLRFLQLMNVNDECLWLAACTVSPF